MSNNNQNLPPLRGNPIPQAPLNQNPSHGRPGPIVQVPIPRNLDGRPDYNRAPGLDLSHFVPVGNNDINNNNEGGNNNGSGGGGGRRRLNTNQPPTEGLEGTPSFSGTNEKKYKSMASQKKNGGEEGEEEAAAEDDDDDADSDFSLVEAPIMTPTTPEADAQAATDLLSEKIPPELIGDILDHAEYFAHETIGLREDSLTVFEGDKLYLSAKIPEFTAMEKDTPGKNGAEGAGGRKGRVRKVVFKIKGCDQGWSSYGSEYGTFRGCWSWVDVEVWRKKEDGSGGEYKVLESLLQRNRHAKGDAEEYEIVWRWDQDKLLDCHEGKWEDGVLDANGEIRDGAAWEKGGRHERNGEFVRELRGGDELRVIIKARFPGWRCTVERCEVVCSWAV
ncbi:hypothetical protein TWF730_004951 [Orbilia blumenaviensis]|uniref:Uncharacterized protein n=1 Tax=Orbilia blumenaviensis TaxID=1796055 RepID=A0AAV9VHY9_9PEZI